MRTVGEILDDDGDPLDDADPQRRGIFALHPSTGHPPDTGHPVRHLIGIDLKKRRTQADLSRVENLLAGHRPDPDYDNRPRRHRRREVQHQCQRDAGRGQHNRPDDQPQTLDRARAGSLRLLDDLPADPTLGFTTSLFDRGGTLLSGPALGTLPALPPSRAFGVLVWVALVWVALEWIFLGCPAVGRFTIARFTAIEVGDGLVGNRWFGLRFRHLAGTHRIDLIRGVGPDVAAVLIRCVTHGSLRDSALARRAEMISGPSSVTSPAPIVTTTSPGRAAAATCSATVEKSGR